MDNNLINHTHTYANIKKGNNNLINEEPIPSVTTPPFFNFVKFLGKLSMAVWVLVFLFVLMGVGLIGAGGGGPAEFYNTYGIFLIFFEFSLLLISAKVIHKSTTYLAAITPSILLIVGIIAAILFDMIA